MNIQSEIAPLKKVLVHRPYHALLRLTPTNCRDFLFDDVLWPERAAEEHDYFSNLLKEQGIEIYQLAQLLEETLAIPEAKSTLIEQILSVHYHGSAVEKLLTQFLKAISAKELTEYLLGGLTVGELDYHPLGLTSRMLDKEEFVLPPLPNHLFTRDTSTWIGSGVVMNSMMFQARRGESTNLSIIYQYHPLFQKEKPMRWYEGSDLAHRLPAIEGGDIAVLTKNTVMIGVGERTQPQAIEALARTLFKNNVVSQVIAVKIPKARASMHLDTLITMIDHDTFCTGFPVKNIPSWTLRPGDSHTELLVDENKDFFKTLATAVGQSQLKIIHVGGNHFSQQREQWCDASNLLAIRPGVVIGYECNVETNRLLKKAGIKVLPIPSSELSRGRGGSHCMSCPLLRETL